MCASSLSDNTVPQIQNLDSDWTQDSVAEQLTIHVFTRPLRLEVWLERLWLKEVKIHTKVTPTFFLWHYLRNWMVMANTVHERCLDFIKLGPISHRTYHYILFQHLT